MVEDAVPVHRQVDPRPSPGPRRWVQAPVAPLDVDGFGVAGVGTALFAVAALVTGLLQDRLAADGRGWWFGVALCGLALGLLGLAYCGRLRRRRLAGDRPPAG